MTANGHEERARRRAPDRPEIAVAHFGQCARIRDMVAAEFGISSDMILSDRRDYLCSHPRQIAMYLCKELTRFSVPRIAQVFNRDHTTVLYAVIAVQGRMERDPVTRDKVERIKRRLSDPALVAVENVVGEAATRRADEIEALARRAFAIDPERTVAAIVAVLKSILPQAQDEGGV